MKKIGITPNGITHFRLILAGLFFILFNYNRMLSISLMIISVLLDMFDGPLARYLDVASGRGRFTDVLVDDITYVIILMTFFFQDNVTPILIGVNAAFIGYINILEVVGRGEILRKKDTIKSEWIIQPKAKIPFFRSSIMFFPFTAFLLYHLFSIDFLELSLYIGFILIAVNFIYFYTKVYARWDRLVLKK